MQDERPPRHLPVGAEFIPVYEAVHFRVWAPQAGSVAVVLSDRQQPVVLHTEPNGYFSGFAEGVRPGTLYKYTVGGSGPFPDPASRFQPTGPHGFSEVIDPNAFTWTDKTWRGIALAGQVVYEMHIGTFTQEGTWRSAAEKLEYLRDTGVTAIEVMPVADFPGRFGWGYDGVQLYAPASIYGQPDQMRSFVDRAHSLGVAVLLDVVYNHIGPDGDYLAKFSPFYFSPKYETNWGKAINYDGEHCGPVREFFRENAAYWIREFHLDGLRFDATQDLHDESQPHILAEIAAAARTASGRRNIVLVGENEPQQTALLKPASAGGCGLDALWNDDYHHTAMVALTGRNEAYYSDYRGTPQEFVSSAKYGYLFQGQRYRWQRKRRGTPALDLPKEALVAFLQNHDQVANSARGQRIHEIAAPGKLRAMTALTLLGPGTPMLFQGQEFASSSPFLYFADHKPELADRVARGRVEFLAQWRSLATPEMRSCFPAPGARETFERSKLNFCEVERHAAIYALHRDLLMLRRKDPVISRQAADGIDGAVLSADCFVLRFFSPGFSTCRLLLINLGTDLHLDPAPEPLLAPPCATQWRVLWSSEDPRYGGSGTPAPETEENWNVPGLAAIVMAPAPLPAAQSGEHSL